MVTDTTIERLLAGEPVALAPNETRSQLILRALRTTYEQKVRMRIERNQLRKKLAAMKKAQPALRELEGK